MNVPSRRRWRMRSVSAPGGGSSISSSCNTSGPPGLWIRTAFMASTEMLTEEIIRSGVGQIGTGLVVMLAAFAGKSVIHLGIDVNAHQGIALERIDDRLLRFRRHVLVFAGDVQKPIIDA